MSSQLPFWVVLLFGGLIGSWAKLVLIGGNLRDDNGAIYDQMIKLSGGRSTAKIGILTAASSDAIYNG